MKGGSLRVAVVTPAVNRRGGGTERCLSLLIEQMASRCQLTVYTAEMTDTDSGAAQVRLVPAIPGPRLARYLTFLISGALVFALDRLRGRRFDVVLATGGDSPFSDVVYAHFCCRAWLDRIRDGSVDLPSARLGQRLRNLHYLTFLSVAAAWERVLLRSRRLRSVIAVSTGIRRELVAAFGLEERLFSVVPNAVDAKVRIDGGERERLRSEVRRRHGVEPTALVVLFVAAGDWKRKGLLVALEGIARLANPDLRFLVVGNDDLEFYAGAAARLGIAGQVIFCGFRRDVEAYYAAADVFLYPSQYEAMALVGLEAAGAGLAILTTRINGTEDFIRDGGNGLFLEADPADVAEKLGLVVDDASLRERLAAAARSDAGDYTPEAVAGAILGLCARVAG